MIETAVCRYRCPNCSTELEQEGFVIVEAEDTEAARQVLDGVANLAECPECNTPSRLDMPLIYHDARKELLIVFVPRLAQMPQEELAEFVRHPYGILAQHDADRRGIELPEPDEAAFPRDEEDQYENIPGIRFHALTQEQAENYYPIYFLRPTLVDNFDVLRTAAQAVREGMTGQELNDDMARLQLINNILAAPDAISRRKVLTHGGPYINDELYVVIDTLVEQMGADGQAEIVERLHWVRDEVARYRDSLTQRLNTAKARKVTKPATLDAEAESAPVPEASEEPTE